MYSRQAFAYLLSQRTLSDSIGASPHRDGRVKVEYDFRTPVALFHDLAWRGVLGKGSAITLFRPFGGARLEAERLNYCFYEDL